MKKGHRDKKMLILLAILLIFLLSFVFDRTILSFMQSINCFLLDYIAEWFSHIASIIIVLLIMTSLFLWEEKKKQWIKPLWTSFFATSIISIIIKFIIMRPRPFFDVFFVLTRVPDYSFPSMHTALAFSVLPVLDKEYPKLKWFWFLFAISIGLSRLYLGTHYLSDVIGGAVIGYLTGVFVISKKWEKRKH